VSARGLRSGELAERAGVNVQTLRYYERRGLLAAPAEFHRHARAKIAELDARIDHLSRMRQALQTVLAADCDSLTDCSCGLAGQLPG
jgi:MerR family mercuric resistance operon transcriptional regulator